MCEVVHLFGGLHPNLQQGKPEEQPVCWTGILYLERDAGLFVCLCASVCLSACTSICGCVRAPVCSPAMHFEEAAVNKKVLVKALFDDSDSSKI